MNKFDGEHFINKINKCISFYDICVPTLLKFELMRKNIFLTIGVI